MFGYANVIENKNLWQSFMVSSHLLWDPAGLRGLVLILSHLNSLRLDHSHAKTAVYKKHGILS
jgi:hypothetical protein